MAKQSSPHGKKSPNVSNRAIPMVKRRSLHDDVRSALLTLGFALPADALDTALSVAEKESLSHLEFLHRLSRGWPRRWRDLDFRRWAAAVGEFGAVIQP